MATSLIERTPSAYDYQLLIKQLLYTPLAVAPHQEIVYKDKSRYTYSDLRRRIGRLASGLADMGVKLGDTVAVMDRDSHRYLECYFAIPMMGAVLQTVNVLLSPEQILYTLNHAEAKYVLCNAEFAPILEKIKDRLETVHTFILISDGNEYSLSSLGFATEYEDLLRKSREDFAFPDFDENTRATTFYTTGTTGNPKGVYFSHRQIVLHTLSALGTLASPATQQRFHRDDVYMPITPMFHVHAWGLPYVATAMGVKQVYPGRYIPEALVTLMKREKVTFSHCVPTILRGILIDPASSTIDLSGWKVIIGGSALDKGLAKMAMDRGIDIFTGYGMSETCPIMSLAQLKSSLFESQTEANWELDYRTRTGLPALLVDLRIVDENMQDVPHDGKATGEVVARTPWLTQGYLKDPDNSEQLWYGGYLHTNDIGTIDPDGYLQVTDRIKDVIKSGGEWISSLTLESIISQYPGVREVAVIGRPDERWGERPLALVLATDRNTVTEQGIQTHVKASAEQGIISKWAVPDVRFVDTLEKTSVGKLDKKLLRKKYII
jgi:fatty-acyl-CoA synthase